MQKPWQRIVQLLALPVLLNCLMLPVVQAQNESSEYQIKAAFLYQFTSYVEWPESAFADSDSPLVFGILDSEPMYANLLALTTSQNTQNAQRRRVEVRRLENGDQGVNLHVLFMGSSSPFTTDLQQLRESGSAVLVVTETPELQIDLSMINFAVVDNRVKFDIALIPAERAGLKLSARLLQVAQRVVTEP